MNDKNSVAKINNFFPEENALYKESDFIFTQATVTHSSDKSVRYCLNFSDTLIPFPILTFPITQSSMSISIFFNKPTTI